MASPQEIQAVQAALEMAKAKGRVVVMANTKEFNVVLVVKKTTTQEAIRKAVWQRVEAATKNKEEAMGQDDDHIFKAEKILRTRKVKGAMLYQVKWKGFGAKHSTWEPEANILDQRLIHDFERNRLKKAANRKKEARLFRNMLAMEAPVAAEKKKRERKPRGEASTMSSVKDLKTRKRSTKKVKVTKEKINSPETPSTSGLVANVIETPGKIGVKISNPGKAAENHPEVKDNETAATATNDTVILEQKSLEQVTPPLSNDTTTVPTANVGGDATASTSVDSQEDFVVPEPAIEIEIPNEKPEITERQVTVLGLTVLVKESDKKQGFFRERKDDDQDEGGNGNANPVA